VQRLGEQVPHASRPKITPPSRTAFLREPSLVNR
jgi:hypothetical protein